MSIHPFGARSHANVIVPFPFTYLLTAVFIPSTRETAKLPVPSDCAAVALTVQMPKRWLRFLLNPAGSESSTGSAAPPSTAIGVFHFTSYSPYSFRSPSAEASMTSFAPGRS